jgi:ESS family glutamate:Na+ symporter
MLTSWIFVLALLFVGNIAARRSRLLLALNFPGSLVGGALGAVLLVILQRGFSAQVELPEGPRDLLLVVFYVCNGLAMTTASWRAAGLSLVSLSAVCAMFIVLQNIVGIATLLAFGLDPIYGVMSGSVAYVGGLGSAVAWGSEAVAQGATNAVEVGIVSATLGLLISALICGPYVAFAMKRDRLRGSIELDDDPASPRAVASAKKREERRFTETEIVFGLLLVCLSLYLGDMLGAFFGRYGLTFPRFLSAMIAGVLVSTAMEQTAITLDRSLVVKLGDICLSVFIVLTLSFVELGKLQGAVGSVLVVALAQTVTTLVLVHVIIYRRLGRNYESLGLAGGFLGFLLGSFAVAMATVRNTELRFGPLPRAVLLVTLVGGVLSNVLNSLIVLVFFTLMR